MLDELISQPLSLSPLSLDGYDFYPVMALPESLPVFDFSVSYDPDRMLSSPYGVGKYDELRPTMYTEEHFTQDVRNIHMGIDLAAPVGTKVYAFHEGEVFAVGLNDLPQDYGPTVITVHEFDGEVLYALYGHLSLETLSQVRAGQHLSKGDVIGAVGGFEENGGWNPHLHFQLSRVRPITHDLPGVVSARHRQWARRAFPDPRLILGSIY